MVIQAHYWSGGRPALQKLLLVCLLSLFVQPVWPFATLTMYVHRARAASEGAKDPYGPFARSLAALVQKYMPTTGAIYASNRNHNEDSEVDGDKRQPLLTIWRQ